MNENDVFSTYGLFDFSPGRRILGELNVSGTDSYLLLNDGDSFSIDNQQKSYITGTLHDLTQVTLIDCIITNSKTRSCYGDNSHYLQFFPHFIVTGDRHLSPNEKIIRKISIYIEDANALFYDFDTFGILHDARPFIKLIVDVKKLDRKIEIGEYPSLAYFTGKYEICNVTSVLGEISAQHNPSFNMGGPDGIRIDNSISVSIIPNQFINFFEATKRTLDLLRFFEIVIGRKQKLDNFLLYVQDQEKTLEPLRVQWSFSPRLKQESNETTGRPPHPGDVLTNPILYLNEFSEVLSKWLKLDISRKDARIRFSNSFSQTEYTIDRLVCAANMFDILPESATPKDIELSEEIQEAKNKCKDIFGNLSYSYERDSILNALGRLGKCSLKHKVRHRANYVIDAVGERFPNLILVLDEAVNCRNHYVHGTKTKIDYSHNSDLLIFFTNTLEFVFATSDLIESGWNIRSWCERGTTMSDPFGSYLINYKYNLAILEDCLSNKTIK